MVAPALIWFTTDDGPVPPGAVRVAISDAAWAARRRQDDIVRITDCRGADRKLCVIDAGLTGCAATLRSTTYLEPGLRLRAGDDVTTIGALPSRRTAIELHVGDTLTVTADPGPQDPGARPPRIGCTLDAVFSAARPGERIWFDDGKIGGVIIGVDPGEMRVEITYARPKGSKLRGGKGINLPDTNLDVGAITLQDDLDLTTAATLANVVQASFVRTAADVERLQEALARHGGEHLGIVLKIETVAGFENLPEIVLTALRSRRVGVMIARGDLAVEAGYERLAEVQEEILWLCEAAHVPVIWATEVLDLLAGGGRPSRAEVSDAALSGRAECVMLNKGPHIEAAITTLDDILVRMHSHQQKKRSLLRRLRAWDHDRP